MSTTINLDEAQAKLKDWIHQLAPGDEIIITEYDQPVARPAPGLGKGSILHMAPDFDAPLEEFKEYME